MAAWTATSATVIKVTAGKPREMAFTITPSKVSAGTVTFQVTNAGKVAHAFQVCSSPLGGTASKCSGPKTAVLAPGKTARLVAKLGIGKHEYLDPVTGHAAAKGTLVVIAATGGGTTTTTKGGSTGGTGGTAAAAAAVRVDRAAEAERPRAPAGPRGTWSAIPSRVPASSRTPAAPPATR